MHLKYPIIVGLTQEFGVGGRLSPCWRTSVSLLEDVCLPVGGRLSRWVFRCPRLSLICINYILHKNNRAQLTSHAVGQG